MSLVACEKLDKFTQFSIEYNTTFTIPDNTAPQTVLDLGTQTLLTDKEILAQYNTEQNLIEEATVKKLILSFQQSTNAGQNDPIDFLTDVEVYLVADNLPSIRLAWKNNIQPTQNDPLELDFLSDNLSEYLKKDNIKLNILVKTNRSLHTPIDFDVKLSVYINAQVTGV